MTAITTRASKGAPLTNEELDANFTNLRDAADVLSAVTAAALHRSPNAIVAQFIYDTSKDSDGGAWTERMQHTSWNNEALNGAWLGQHASEAAARAATGAATGAYFQLTTDGKFYKLNAGAGTTEVFRGNKAKFPRLAAIVAEAASVTIYDLTEAGRPMWLRVDIKASGVMIANSGGQVVTCVSMLNGTLLIGGTAATQYGWLFLFSFPADKVDVYDQQAVGHHTLLRGIDGRHAARSEVPATGTLVSPLVNAVAMTVLPDAPIDVATGLQVPTIAVATKGGVSVIKQDGTVVNWTNNVPSTIYGAHIFFTKDGKVAWQDGADQTYWRAVPLSNFPSSGTTYYQKSAGVGDEFYAGDLIQATIANPDLRFVPGTSEKLSVLRLKRNPSKGAAGLALGIKSDFNAGYLPGDIRRAYLANTEVESITAPELVTNGAFASDTAWTKGAGVTISGGVASFSGVAAEQDSLLQNYGGVNGVRYEVKFTVTGFASGSVKPTFGGVEGAAVSANGTYRSLIVNNGNPNLIFKAGAANTTLNIDDVSVKIVVPDRSYKAAGASIVGTLTKTAVASAAQLVAYSGFSAANYLQEPYSADLDFGTGDFCVMGWVNLENGPNAQYLLNRGGAAKLAVWGAGDVGYVQCDLAGASVATPSASVPSGQWVFVVFARAGGTVTIYVNARSSVSGSLPGNIGTGDAVEIGKGGNANTKFALLRVSATAPAAEHIQWIYEQEKQMFRDGANITLPDSGAIVDLAYDEAQDKWVAVSAANESSWTGLVRTSSAPASAGSITKVAAQSGVKLLARSTTSPGVDVSIPAYGLREELVKRAEQAAKIAKNVQVFDFDTIGFTASTTNGSNQLTSVSVTSGTPYVGMGVSGSGIPAGTTITGINGTTYTISANATATATGVAIGQTDFTLPVGYTASGVMSAGSRKREGATKDWTRLYDGFRETVRFGTSPGSATWVQINAAKE